MKKRQWQLRHYERAGVAAAAGAVRAAQAGAVAAEALIAQMTPPATALALETVEAEGAAAREVMSIPCHVSAWFRSVELNHSIWNIGRRK